MNFTTRTGYAAVGILALAGGLLFSFLQPDQWLVGKQEPAATTVATVIPTPRPLAPFTLTDHLGAGFSTESLQGRWSFLSFGYTHCPDICPTTLMMLAQVVEKLKADQVPADYRVVFVSIDPERDTQQQLAQYVPYFNPDFVGVRGEQESLKKLTSQLGIIYLKVSADRDSDDYLMDHSASIVLIDPQGRFHAVFSAPHDAAAIAADFKIISSY